MTNGTLILLVVALAMLAFFLARRRALASVAGDARKLHSLPRHHGQAAFLLTALPALCLILAWLSLQPVIVDAKVRGLLAAGGVGEGASLELALADAHRIGKGLDRAVAGGRVAGDALAALRGDVPGMRSLLKGTGVALGEGVAGAVFDAALDRRAMVRTGHLAMAAAVLALAVAALGFGIRRIRPEFRARNVAEAFVLGLLVAASLIAILTTLGIVASLLFEALHFFRIYPAAKFFLSTVWNPQFRGGSDLGIWPLLWGTLYVSVIALVVAVPIGLMAAVYLSEYASTRARAWIKPAIELLAGIPTIVYGLFALATVGPLLRDWFAQPLGLGSSSSSVMTAGLVMGIMIIPFVSSLSDDIINAVPQSLRDGSLGLGATASETVRRVVLPAALPGIVGAVLLAASRAIGETMIVVMGAGAAAKLSLNPFEAMTTVTVKIVSQLTGDTEFASPETLVAFALGLTLFVMTLGLNILALWIVRRYREQYE